MSPLFAKLRIKPGMRICILGAPSGVSAEANRLPKSIERAPALRGRFDVVLTFVTRRSQVTRGAAKLKAALAPKGILWIAYPKGEALGTDLDRDRLHEAASEHDLSGVAIVKVDETWSAMRFRDDTAS